jgi:alcohol dehydrogenase (NADP+)
MSPSSAQNRISSLSNHLKPKMSTPYKFEGWLGLDKSAAQGNMIWKEYEPKTWTEDDVDIKISHCGICGSDIHTLRSGWVFIPSLLLLIFFN